MAKHFGRGLIAGVAGGLVASWIMNEFLAGPGGRISEQVSRTTGQSVPKQDGADSTALVADTVTSIATGGRHLTYEQQTRAGSAIHYIFGALVGGVYGAAVEVAPGVGASFGTTFGTALFLAADVIAVPVLNLGKYADEQGPGPVAEYLAAHLLYGASTELVRRLIRRAL